MGKVSVGLRGWRFDEQEIFTDDEQFKPLDEIPADPRQRLLRLLSLVDKPCDCCYIIHGAENKQQCNRARAVYGEALDEVLLCDDHETDFIYWYQHAGGSDLRGSAHFSDQFHEWFASGKRAPDSFGRIEHVETDPEALPELPSPDEIQARFEATYEPRTIDLRDYMETPENASLSPADRFDDEELAELETSYPTDE